MHWLSQIKIRHRLITSIPQYDVADQDIPNRYRTGIHFPSIVQAFRYLILTSLLCGCPDLDSMKNEGHHHSHSHIAWKQFLQTNWSMPNKMPIPASPIYLHLANISLKLSYPCTWPDVFLMLPSYLPKELHPAASSTYPLSPLCFPLASCTPSARLSKLSLFQSCTELTSFPWIPCNLILQSSLECGIAYANGPVIINLFGYFFQSLNQIFETQFPTYKTRLTIPNQPQSFQMLLQNRLQ